MDCIFSRSRGLGHCSELMILAGPCWALFRDMIATYQSNGIASNRIADLFILHNMHAKMLAFRPLRILKVEIASMNTPSLNTKMIFFVLRSLDCACFTFGVLYVCCLFSNQLCSCFTYLFNYKKA